MAKCCCITAPLSLSPPQAPYPLPLSHATHSLTPTVLQLTRRGRREQWRSPPGRQTPPVSPLAPLLPLSPPPLSLVSLSRQQSPHAPSHMLHWCAHCCGRRQGTGQRNQWNLALLLNRRLSSCACCTALHPSGMLRPKAHCARSRGCSSRWQRPWQLRFSSLKHRLTRSQRAATRCP